MTAHTAGPWTSRKQYANRWRIEHTVEGCIPLSIAIVATTICEVGAARPGLSEANARLIAAAPELLQACKALSDAVCMHGPCEQNNCSDCVRAYKAAQAAIAKAVSNE